MSVEVNLRLCVVGSWKKIIRMIPAILATDDRY